MKIHTVRKLLAASAVALALHGVLLAQALVVSVPEPYTDTGIPFAPAHAAAVQTPSAPNAWGGPRTGQEPTLSDRVANYRIEATLDPVRHTIDGREQLTWRNRSQRTVGTVYLHLYLNAFEHANTTFFTEHRNRGGDTMFGGGADGGWGRTELRGVTQGGAKVAWSFVQPDDGPQGDHTVVRFDLPRPVAPGASTTLDIAFFSQLPRVIARSGYHGSFHLVAQWFPKIGVLELPGERGATAERWNVHEYHAESEFYADFGHYDVKLTVPKDYTVGATGELQGAPVEKNGMLTHHYVQGDVHDFAWTADQRFAAPLTGTWRGGAGQAPVQIRVLYTPEYAASAAPSLKAAQEALSYYSATLGPYPYKTLTIVLPPHNAAEASGMEYPTFYTAYGYEQVAPDTEAAFDLDMVNIHEFGHGYFQGVLASNEFEEPMLDEGLNQFWNLRMARQRGQLLHPAPAWLRRAGVSPAFDAFHFERLGAVRESPADPAGQNAFNRLQGIGPAYSRSAILMHDLEAQLGKAALESGFREYYRRWRFRHPSVADLREALAEGSGQRQQVERIFAQQVYATGKVDDRVQAIISEEVLPQPGSQMVDGKRVELTRDQVDRQVDAARERWRKAHPDAKAGVTAGAEAGPFPFRTEVVLRRHGVAVPQTLVVRFADGSSETVKWDAQRGERWQRYVWLKPVKAVSAELDPERRHLLDTNKLDDSRTVEPDSRASRRWTFDFAAVVQLLLTLAALV